MNSRAWTETAPRRTLVLCYPTHAYQQDPPSYQTPGSCSRPNPQDDRRPSAATFNEFIALDRGLRRHPGRDPLPPGMGCDPQSSDDPALRLHSCRALSSGPQPRPISSPSGIPQKKPPECPRPLEFYKAISTPRSATGASRQARQHHHSACRMAAVRWTDWLASHSFFAFSGTK